LWANPVTLGYSQVESPLRQLAFWGGLPLVGLAVMVCSVALEMAWSQRRLIPVAVCTAVVLVFSFAPARLRSQASQPTLKFAIVQGNHHAGAGSKNLGQTEAIKTARKYAELSAKSDTADLLVWPESSYPEYLEDERIPKPLQSALSSLKTVLFGGMRTSSWTHDSFNTAFLSQAGKVTAVYEKQYPVPLFEDHFTRGNRLASLEVHGVSVGVGICWDSLVPELARDYALGSRGVLVYLADTSFAVNTETARYHMRASSMRAAETGRYVVHASQAGPSAVFDDSGALVQITSSDSAQMLNQRVPARSMLTPYTRFGDWVLVFLTVIVGTVVLDWGFRVRMQSRKAKYALQQGLM
jgi:apolipoprotein N-acyltransferase